MWIVRLLINAIVIVLIANFVPGVSVDSYGTAILVAIILALINVVIKPIVMFLSLPIRILTLGLFTLIINTALLALTAYLVNGFEISSFISALIASIIISIVSSILNMVMD